MISARHSATKAAVWAWPASARVLLSPVITRVSAAVFGFLVSHVCIFALALSPVAHARDGSEMLDEFMQHVHRIYIRDVRREVISPGFDAATSRRDQTLAVNVSAMAQIYGYALGQELRYVRGTKQRPTKQYTQFQKLEKLVRKKIATLAAFSRHNRGVRRQNWGLQEYVALNDRIISAAMIGTMDGELAALTSVRPGEAPPFLDPPIMESIITAADLKAGKEGEKVVELRRELKELSANAKRYRKGSSSFNAIKRLYDAKKAEYDRIGKPLRGVRGTPVMLYGPRAIDNAQSVKAQIAERLGDLPKWRKRLIHAWFDRTGRLAFGLKAPPLHRVLRQP